MDLEREKGITIKSHAIAMEYTRARRADLRAQPDRHAGPRRLHLRGVAQPRRLRGRDPGRGRVAGRSRRRRSRTTSWRATRSSPSSARSTRSTCRRRGPTTSRSRSSTSPACRPSTCAASAPRPGSACAELLEQVIADVPPPAGDPDAPLRALIFDSKFDQYRGVVALVRVVDGAVKAGDHDPLPVDRQDARGHRGGHAAPQARAAARAARRPGRLRGRRRQDRRRRARRRHDRRRRRRRGARAAAGLPRAQVRWCSRGSTRSTPSSTSR